MLVDQVDPSGIIVKETKCGIEEKIQQIAKGGSRVCSDDDLTEDREVVLLLCNLVFCSFALSYIPYCNLDRRFTIDSCFYSTAFNNN
jgi:hypothetical protein